MLFIIFVGPTLQNFLPGLYSAAEQNADNVKEKQAKLDWLDKLIDSVKAATNSDVPVRAAKIAAGAEPHLTNQLLQLCAKIVIENIDTTAAVQTVLARTGGVLADSGATAVPAAATTAHVQSSLPTAPPAAAPLPATVPAPSIASAPSAPVPVPVPTPIPTPSQDNIPARPSSRRSGRREDFSALSQATTPAPAPAPAPQDDERQVFVPSQTEPEARPQRPSTAGRPPPRIRPAHSEKKEPQPYDCIVY